MKKLLCFLLCILCLQGCESKKEVKNQIPDFLGFKTDVNTTMNDVKISARVECMSFDKLILTFSLPESVNGMQIVFENDEYTLTYDDLTFSLSENSVPFSMVCEMIKVCAENVKSATFEKSFYTFTCNGHRYNLATGEGSDFQKLTVDDIYIVYFENFEYIMGHTEPQ